MVEWNERNSLPSAVLVLIDIYSHFGSDMEISEYKFKSEVKRWRQKWSGKNANVTPKTFVEAFAHDNRQFHLGVYANIVDVSYVNMHCWA